ncbi:DUF6179 domain-containing protein [Sedimentibacter sp. zth1]|uniref:DUF6179 domain-containing protein n=1 Tax=Sedimentibacter sp. zth1 TaxID=2816908 RepID=UPI001F5F9D37|nr:DUF6179 domain-containing protein [Sedimentibacter sp. zth1]
MNGINNAFDANANMNELALLLQQRAKKYTVNDSSSISIEKAQQLMSSILYCINGYLNSIETNTNVVVTTTEADYVFKLFNEGLKFEKANFEYAKNLYKDIQHNALKTDNMSYQDTVFDGLAEFFNKYDVQYAAHETPGSIDYQLFLPVEELTGIEYIVNYLETLRIEDLFCKKFDASNIKALLKGYNSDYTIMLLNIYEIVLLNSIGLAMLRKNVLLLSIDIKEKNKLFFMLKDLSIFQIEEKVLNSLNNIFKQLDINDAKQKKYMKSSAIKLSKYIKNSIGLNINEIFVTCDYRKDIEKDEYVDGQAMNNKKLRKLISEMQECRYTSDKLAIIKTSIHSLADLVEILDSCIWDDEYEQVYKMLGDIEINLLVSQITDKINMGENIKELKDWELQLLHFVNNYS